MTCSYQGHVCGVGRTFFISRYRDENDYCVDGERVHVRDGGWTSGTPEQVERVLLFELGKYAEYLFWRASESGQRLAGDRELIPFSFPPLGIPRHKW